MDYKKLVKSLLCDGSGVGEDINGCANKKCRYRDSDGACNVVSMEQDAAVAINDLLAENQALRNAANGFKKQAEAAEARAEKAERKLDMAIIDIYSGNANDCDTCIHGCDYKNDCNEFIGCDYKWRGLES